MKEAKIRNFLKQKLSTDSVWATKALLRIFERQTVEEQNSETTMHDNNVGFTGADAPFLSSLAKQYKSKGYLSPRQMQLLFIRIPKYWKQIWSISDKDTILKLITGQETIL